MISKEVLIPINGASLGGNLEVPENAKAIVVFAHGSGSSRFSARNRHVAKVLNEKNLGTLLFDLLTAEEETIDMRTTEYRFNIPLLAERLLKVADWIKEAPALKKLKIGCFGASTGAAAALIAAASRPEVYAVVSRGGRPDLAMESLPKVKAPTLLIVGGRDYTVIKLNEEAFKKIRGEKRLEIVKGATHLFEEPGALEEVARLTGEWFLKHL